MGGAPPLVGREYDKRPVDWMGGEAQVSKDCVGVVAYRL